MSEHFSDTTVLRVMNSAIPQSAQQVCGDVCLSISARNLPNEGGAPSPICIVYGVDTYFDDRPLKVGETERVHNSCNPEWAFKPKLAYFFEERQKLMFKIYDYDWVGSVLKLRPSHILGRLEISLSEIVGAPGGTVERRLTGVTGNGIIRIAANEVQSSLPMVYMTWTGVNLDKVDVCGKSDPFLLFYRISNNGSRILVYRTEIVKDTQNPHWAPIRIPLKALCSGDMKRQFMIVCMDWDFDGRHHFIGNCTVTMKMLLHSDSREFALKKESGCCCCWKRTDAGCLKLMQCELKMEHSFLDYIRGGTQLHFAVAVDFTASNGDPSAPDSLHRVRPAVDGQSQRLNDYELAIMAVGSLCQHYSSTKLFPAFGFGAQIPPLGLLSHCFNLNFLPDPNCAGVAGVLDAYRSAITKTTLHGPRVFAPVINRMADVADQHKDGSCFYILLIVTDGIICDMEATKAAIVRASSLPMAIIIVGVGSADFSDMAVFDGSSRLTSQGREADSDIVQFVPMRDFLPSSTVENCTRAEDTLAKAVLEELPRQLTDWMRKHNVTAHPPLPPPPPMPFMDDDSSLQLDCTQPLSSSTSSHRTMNFSS